MTTAGWREVVRAESVLREFTSYPQTVFKIGILEQALAMPYFRDACPIDPAVDCPYLIWLELHLIRQISILQNAVAGDWKASLSQTSDLIRADTELLRSSRRLLSGQFAVLCSWQTMHLLRVLLEGLPREINSGVPRQLREMLPQLDSLTDEMVTAQRAVISEYLFVRKSIQMISDHEARFSSVHLLLLKRVMFDPSRALRAETPYFQQLAEFSKGPSTASVPQRLPLSEQKFWWIDNPMGKRTVDLMLQNLNSGFQKLKEDHSLLTSNVAIAKAKLETRIRSPVH